jgi:Family of unknown function (DUF6062)
MSEAHTLLYEIRTALASEGCAICRLAERSVQRYLSALANEGVTDRELRDQIRAAYGFCAAHGRMLRTGRDALGSAIIHRDMINNLNKALLAEPPLPSTAAARMRRTLRPGNPVAQQPFPAKRGCTACEQLRIAEQRYCAALALGMADNETLAAFQTSAGICVPHLRLTLRTAPDPESYERLRAGQSAIWQRLLDELDEFIRKQDHRFTREPSGPESDSWRRAIDLVAGKPECDGKGY